MKHLFRLAAGTCLLAVMLGAHPKIAPDLEGLPSGSQVNVIVQYRTAVTEAQREKVGLLGGLLRLTLGLVQSVLYTLNVDDLLKVAEDPDVLVLAVQQGDHVISHAVRIPEK